MMTPIKAFWKPLTISSFIIVALYFFSHSVYQAGIQKSDLTWKLKEARRLKDEATNQAREESIARNEEERRKMKPELPQMKLTKNLRRYVLKPLTLSLLVTSCAPHYQTSSASLQPVKPAGFQPLPQQARQEPKPPFCLPTCLTALTSERENWRNMLTGQELPVRHANASITQPTNNSSK